MKMLGILTTMGSFAYDQWDEYAVLGFIQFFLSTHHCYASF